MNSAESGDSVNSDFARIVERYALLLIDLYGVLVTEADACPGAAGFLQYLNRIGKPYLVLTNDASRSSEATAARLRGFGMAVPPARIITSGSLLCSYFAQNDLQGSRCGVLGTADSEEYVRQAGGHIVELTDEAEIDVLVVCDDRGFAFLETINAAITVVFRALDNNRSLHLVLPNPDYIYPRSQNGFGITAGSVAVLIEKAIEVRYPHRPPCRFAPLGKPYRPIYERAAEIGRTRNMLMIGDQIATDVLGAQRFGIDSLLLSQGVTNSDSLVGTSQIVPTYVLSSLIHSD